MNVECWMTRSSAIWKMWKWWPAATLQARKYLQSWSWWKSIPQIVVGLLNSYTLNVGVFSFEACGTTFIPMDMKWNSPRWRWYLWALWYPMLSHYAFYNISPGWGGCKFRHLGEHVWLIGPSKRMEVYTIQWALERCVSYWTEKASKTCNLATDISRVRSGISCISLIISTFARLLAPNHTLLYTFFSTREVHKRRFSPSSLEEFRSNFSGFQKKRTSWNAQKKQENYSNMTTSWKTFLGLTKRWIYIYIYFPLS